MKKKIKLFEKKEKCCGCGGCYQKCPVKAIIMKRDEEGFLYPQIDYDKCIGCEICIKVCNFKNRRKLWNK